MRKKLPLIFSVLLVMAMLYGVGHIYAVTWNKVPVEATAEKIAERHKPEPRAFVAAAPETQKPTQSPVQVAAVGGPFVPVNSASDSRAQAATETGEPVRAAGGALVNKFDAAALREGVALVVEKKFAEGLAKLKPLEEVASGNQDFDVAYGIALLETGKPNEAAVPLRRALTADPNNMLARTQLARALSASGQLDAARREVEVIRAREDLTPEVRSAMDRNAKNLGEAIERRDTTRRLRVAQAGTGSGGVSGSDGATLKKAAELVRAKKPNEAIAVLNPLQGRLGGNPDYDYVYGVATLDAGRPAEAVVYLRRAVQNRPGFHVARAEYGRALAAMGDLEGARREFAQVRDVPNLPVAARDAMGREVVGIDRAIDAVAQQKNQPRTTISGYVEQAIGYDTNVNGGPAGMSILIPGLSFLGPAQLNPAAAPREAGFYEFAVGLNIAHAISNDTAVFANFIGNIHRLFDHTEFSTALVGTEIGVARQTGDGSIWSLAVIGQAFWIDDDVYRGIYGLAGQWRKKVGEWDANVALTWLGIEYPNTPGMSSADRFMASAGIGRKLGHLAGTPSFLLTLSGGTEVTRDSAADHFGYDFVGVRYSGEISLAPRLIGFGQAAYEYHSHHEDYPLFFVPRKEHLFEILMGLEWKATDRISYRPTVRWSRTASNVDLFDVERWIWSLTARYSF